MKELLILRHAKSSWAVAGVPDFERALNARGDRQLRLLSKWLSDNPPGASGGAETALDVLCSPAKRTRLTLAAIEEQLPNARTSFVDALYSGMVEIYLESVWASSADTVLIIGHNPTCDELTRYLTAPSSPAFEKLMAHHFGTANLARLQFDGDAWTQLRQGGAQLVDFIRPKDLEHSLSV